MKQVKTAIFGTGFIGRVHLDAVRRLESVETVAIADTNIKVAQSLAAGFAIPTVAADYRDILKDPAVDAVHICTASTADASGCRGSPPTGESRSPQPDFLRHFYVRSMATVSTDSNRLTASRCTRPIIPKIAVLTCFLSSPFLVQPHLESKIGHGTIAPLCSATIVSTTGKQGDFEPTWTRRAVGPKFVPNPSGTSQPSVLDGPSSAAKRLPLPLTAREVPRLQETERA